MFDNASLAAQLTAIVKDPMDAQHLNIDSLRFIKDENWIQFEVKSTEDTIIKDSAAKKGQQPPKAEKKVSILNIISVPGQLVQLQISKNRSGIHGGRLYRPTDKRSFLQRITILYRMDRPNYEKALQNEERQHYEETATDQRWH